jgi:sensor domain CHASE-containing protein
MLRSFRQHGDSAPDPVHPMRLPRALPRLPSRSAAVAPLAALVGVALVLSGIAVYVGSARQDALQRLGEERIVAQSTRGLGRALSTAALDYSWWDDAVRFLGRDLDPDWADDNIGPYIAETFGYEISLVIGADGRAAYGQLDGERTTAEAAATLGADLDRLIARVRETEPLPEPKPSFAVLRGPDGLHAAAASPIVPQAGSTLAPPEGPPNILVFAKRLDQAFLRAVEADFGLGRLAFAQAPTAAGVAAVSLPGPDGAPAGWIAWRPHQPGQGQLVWLLPALLGSVLFCGFTALVVRESERASRAIHESEARFRDVAEASSDWIWETDRRLRLTFVSDHGGRGGADRPSSDVIRRQIQELLLPPAGPGQPRQGITALAGDGPFQDVLCAASARWAKSRARCGWPASPSSTRTAPCAGTAARPPTSPRRCPRSSRRASSPSTTP